MILKKKRINTLILRVWNRTMWRNKETRIIWKRRGGCSECKLFQGLHICMRYHYKSTQGEYSLNNLCQTYNRLYCVYDIKAENDSQEVQF